MFCRWHETDVQHENVSLQFFCPDAGLAEGIVMRGATCMINKS